MFLVAGLGNPGDVYENSPHNLGFLAVDRIAAEWGIRVSRPESKALIGVGAAPSGVPVVLAKPQTFMNLSGMAVKSLLERHAMGPESLILLYDELDLPWGEVRIRPNGRPRGHNGVRSVVEQLGTEDFSRVRLGAHPGHPLPSGADYLLAPMTRQQKKEVEESLGVAAQAVHSLIADGVELSMAKFNRRAGGLQPEER